MRTKAVFVTLAGLVLLVPAIALASHTFSDVPTSYTHHDSISWLADTGVTAGCAPGRYCPGDPVTRGQMATFMKRFYDNLVPDPVAIAADYHFDGDPGPAGNGLMLEVVVTTTSPGLLMAVATADFVNQTEADYLSCGLNFGYAINLAELDSWRAVNLGDVTRDTCSTRTAISVDPGTHTVRLVSSGALGTTSLANGTLDVFFYSDYAWTPLGTDGRPGEAPHDQVRQRS